MNESGNYSDPIIFALWFRGLASKIARRNALDDLCDAVEKTHAVAIRPRVQAKNIDPYLEVPPDLGFIFMPQTWSPNDIAGRLTFQGNGSMKPFPGFLGAHGGVIVIRVGSQANLSSIGLPLENETSRLIDGWQEQALGFRFRSILR